MYYLEQKQFKPAMILFSIPFIPCIIGLIIDDLNKRLADRELTIELTDKASGFIVEQAYDPVYGARPLKRYIQKYVETLSAKLILADKVAPKDTIMIDVVDDELVATKK